MRIKAAAVFVVNSYIIENGMSGNDRLLSFISGPTKKGRKKRLKSNTK